MFLVPRCSIFIFIIGIIRRWRPFLLLLLLLLLLYCCCCDYYYYYSMLVCVFIGWISCHFIIIIIRMSYYCCFVGSTSYTPHLSFQSKERWSQAVAAISFAMEHARLHVSAWKISIFKVPILKLEMGGLFWSS